MGCSRRSAASSGPLFSEPLGPEMLATSHLNPLPSPVRALSLEREGRGALSSCPRPAGSRVLHCTPSWLGWRKALQDAGRKDCPAQEERREEV